MPLDWQAVLAEAGRDPRVAAAALERHGLHLCVARTNAAQTHAAIETLSLGPIFSQFETRLGIPGLGLVSRAVPIDRVAALRAALREGRAGYYADPIAFIGEAIRPGGRLEALVRMVARGIGLGGVAVAPAPGRAVVVLAGEGVTPEAVAPLASWAARLEFAEAKESD